MDFLTIASALLALEPAAVAVITDIVKQVQSGGGTTFTPEQEAALRELDKQADAGIDADYDDARRKLGLA